MVVGPFFLLFKVIHVLLGRYYRFGRLAQTVRHCAYDLSSSSPPPPPPSSHPGSPAPTQHRRRNSAVRQPAAELCLFAFSAKQFEGSRSWRSRFHSAIGTGGRPISVCIGGGLEKELIPVGILLPLLQFFQERRGFSGLAPA